jgi:hypothetical protein
MSGSCSNCSTINERNTMHKYNDIWIIISQHHGDISKITFMMNNTEDNTAGDQINPKGFSLVGERGAVPMFDGVFFFNWRDDTYQLRFDGKPLLDLMCSLKISVRKYY